MRTYSLSDSRGIQNYEGGIDEMIRLALIRSAKNETRVIIGSGPDIFAEVHHGVVEIGRGIRPLIEQSTVEAVEMDDDESAKIWRDALAGDGCSIMEWAEYFGSIERAGYWEDQEVLA